MNREADLSWLPPGPSGTYGARSVTLLLADTLSINIGASAASPAPPPRGPILPPPAELIPRMTDLMSTDGRQSPDLTKDADAEFLPLGRPVDWTSPMTVPTDTGTSESGGLPTKGK